jgi:hypothetical protein
LETYDVDASLKDKLNCLIFIPVVSRTYCDPRSFAWEHEFKAFIKKASSDQFGLKIRLAHGNVACRVLPVLIHDLDAEDKNLFETEMCGILRAIEFIYKEPGVNRPLTLLDDEKKNRNNTSYRNQINKVANAIEELIQCMTKPQLKSVDTGEPHIHEKADNSGATQRLKIKPLNIQNIKKWLILSVVLVFAVSGSILFKFIDDRKQTIEKSIAVLPFINDSPDKENEYFCNGMMDEILNKLQKIKDFRVLSRT